MKAAVVILLAFVMASDDDVDGYVHGNRRHDSECSQIFCPKIYMPVCGTDGKTYGNACALRVHSCQTQDTDLKIKHEGKCEDSNKLLMGKLIGQGASRSELVGAARQQGVSPSQIEEVKGKEVAESSRQHVEPQNELVIGTKIKEYQQNPQDAQVRMDIGGAGRMRPGPIERKHGKVLDGDVQTGKYVSNPIKVLGEIKAKGGNIETVEGEVIAGDAGDVDVVSIKGPNTQSRDICEPPCASGEKCIAITCGDFCMSRASMNFKNLC